MFLGRGVPLRSPHWGRCKTYPYQIQNVFLKDYSSFGTRPAAHLTQLDGYLAGQSFCQAIKKLLQPPPVTTHMSMGRLRLKVLL
jgi:hypothetical protein